MDRQDQYQNYLKKLIIASQVETDDSLLAKLNDKTGYMLLNIKQRMPNREFSIINWVFSVSLVIICFALYFKNHIWYFLMPILMLLIYFIIYRVRFSQTYKSSAFSPIKESETLNNLRYVESKVLYTNRGILIKRLQVMRSRNLLLIFFPLLLVCLFELIIGHHTLVSFISSIALAYIISSYCWYHIFVEDVEELKYYESSLNSDLAKIRQRL